MGNDNERKHDPAENRESRMGSPQDRQSIPGADSDTDTKPVLTGEQEGDDNFGGRTGSGTSSMAANNSRADLGASGEGSPGGQSATGEADEPESEGFIGKDADEDSSDYLQKDGNPEAGFAEQGRGAPAGSGPEGTPERTANKDSDIEGSSDR